MYSEKSNIFLPSLGIIILIFSLSCNYTPMSNGVEGSIVFVCDELQKPVVRPELERVFGKVIHTPQPESKFKITWVNGSELKNITRSPIILLLGSLEGEDAVSRLLVEMFSPDVESGVVTGEYAVFKKTNAWARPQLLMIITGNSNRNLGDNLKAWSDSLYDWAYQFELERLTKEMFRKGEQVDLGNTICEKYGFKLRIQHDYVVAQENDSLNFIRFIRYMPERWIGISWGQMNDISLLTPEFILDQRRNLGRAFLDPVIVYDEMYTCVNSLLNGREVILSNGIWATMDPTGGGPFLSLTLYVPEKRLYYIIDGAVFIPGEPKMPYLWQLEVIARTFAVL